MTIRPLTGVLIIGFVMVICGSRGILNRKNIANKADLILSIGQVASGSICIIIYLVSYFKGLV